MTYCQLVCQLICVMKFQSDPNFPCTQFFPFNLAILVKSLKFLKNWKKESMMVWLQAQLFLLNWEITLNKPWVEIKLHIYRHTWTSSVSISGLTDTKAILTNAGMRQLCNLMLWSSGFEPIQLVCINSSYTFISISSFKEDLFISRSWLCRFWMGLWLQEYSNADFMFK